jgi:hypothetical protein
MYPPTLRTSTTFNAFVGATFRWAGCSSPSPNVSHSSFFSPYSPIFSLHLCVSALRSFLVFFHPPKVGGSRTLSRVYVRTLKLGGAPNPEQITIRGLTAVVSCACLDEFRRENCQWGLTLRHLPCQSRISQDDLEHRSTVQREGGASGLSNPDTYFRRAFYSTGNCIHVDIQDRILLVAHRDSCQKTS